MQRGRIIICLLFVFLVCVVGIVCTCLYIHNIKATGSTKSDTITTTDYDTIDIESPVPRDSIVVRYITRVEPIHHDTDVMQPIISDSIAVTLPITQKTYEDSTYKAWISGYEPNLDSIRIYHRHTTNTITNTIIQKKIKRTGIGIQVGIGITPRGVQPYAGVGFSLNF